MNFVDISMSNLLQMCCNFSKVLHLENKLILLRGGKNLDRCMFGQNNVRIKTSEICFSQDKDQ